MSSFTQTMSATTAAALTLMLNILPFYVLVVVLRTLLHVANLVLLKSDFRPLRWEAFFAWLMSLGCQLIPIAGICMLGFTCQLLRIAATTVGGRVGDYGIVRTIWHSADSAVDLFRQKVEPGPKTPSPSSKRVLLPVIPAWNSRIHQEDKGESRNEYVSTSSAGSISTPSVTACARRAASLDSYLSKDSTPADSFDAILFELELMETEIRLMGLLTSTEDLVEALETGSSRTPSLNGI